MTEEDARLQELVANVAAAYVSNAYVRIEDLPQLIGQISSSLAAIQAGGEGNAQQIAASEPEPAAPAKMTPAQVRKSITDDALVSFEDGRRYKTLRRHLAVKGLTPEQYRAKWGLPSDYPMVSPNYSAQRSAMAKSLGLGARGRGARAAAAKPPAHAPARRGRKPKAAAQ